MATKLKTAFFPRARLDLEEQADYLLENASLETAERFLSAAKKEQTADQLARHPEIGQRWQGLHNATSSLRFWKVSGFPKILFFDRVVEGRIEVVRVLHSARDLSKLI